MTPIRKRSRSTSPLEHSSMSPAASMALSTDTSSAQLAQAEPPGPDDSDRALHALLAPLTGGLSPTALSLAYADWMAHLISAPARRFAPLPGGASRCFFNGWTRWRARRRPGR